MSLKSFLKNKLSKYHKLDLRNPEYKGGYKDKDRLMLYACFNLLKKYVEEEEPFEIINWEADERHSFAAKEIKELYKWWTKDYWQDLKKLDEFLNKVPENPNSFLNGGNETFFVHGEEWDNYIFFEENLLRKEEDNLLRLIKIRRFLWT